MKKVLIVEDDMILTMLNKLYVQQLGHVVVACARSGAAAIEAVKNHDPDVIIMDIRIEGSMDGIETMMEIGKFSNVGVIYVTGNSELSMKARAEKTNMLGFCIKPISIDDLKDIIG